MTKARFYHAGCPVCVSAEQTLLQHLSPMLKSKWFIWESNLIELLRLKWLA